MIEPTESTSIIAKRYQAVVIGVSAGGIAALTHILPKLDTNFHLPVLIVQHIGADAQNYLAEHFGQKCQLRVLEARDKEPIENGHIYFAPPNYHMLIETDKTIVLSTDAKINFSRPSIDALFETAAEVYCDSLVGLILTGANSDGAVGLAKITSFGGTTIVQSPETAEVDTMPLAAISHTSVDHIIPLVEISSLLMALSFQGNE